MAAERRIRGLSGLQQAFDEVRFGERRTLNLRASLPTAAEAATRVENWLRQHQMQRSDELLVVTGRGNNSADGVSVVREAAIRVFHELRRKGVIEGFVEHTAGSFVVTLAPISAAIEASQRRRTQEPPPPPPAPPTLSALDDDIQQRLRVLAERSLDALGIHDRGPFVETEMLRLFGILAPSAGSAAERDAQLRDAIERAMSELD